MSSSSATSSRTATLQAVVLALLCLVTGVASAQDRPVPRWDLYGGYSFLYPNAHVHGQLPGALFPLSSMLESNPKGAGLTGTYNFNRWFGLSLDYSNHWGSGERGLSNRIDDTRFSNLSIGPKFTFRTNHFSPFAEVLIGDHRLVPEAFHRVDKMGFMFGAGLDLNLSRRVAWRMLRADYVYSTYRFAASPVPTTNLRGVRLQTGLVFMFGGDEEVPRTTSAACSAQPTEVFAGEPVTATATGSNFDPKRTIRYSWSGTGVTNAGNNSSIQVDTNGLQAGSYQVAAKLDDGSRAGHASCNASFTVKQRVARENPPTIVCSPNPATVQVGGRSTINSTASSPDNRPLTYSYSSSAGRISGSDSSATLNTSGAQPGPITVSCNVADDRNPALTASSTTTVNVEAPPAQPLPASAPPVTANQLNQIEFKKNSPRVDNAAKAVLDDVALRLQRDYDSKAVLVGLRDSSETGGTRLAAQRALNTKAYLVSEKGIDASRLSTRTGSTAGKETQIWLVPPTATFNTQGTQVVNPR